MTCLRSLWDFFKWIFVWISGFDLDPRSPAAGPPGLPFGDKDGYGVFTALAGFALAQATAVTVVAREEEHKFLVLLVYFVSVLGTLAWIVAMLRAERGVPPVGGAVTPTPSRAYDQPSIKFARWVLGWNCLLAAVLIYLGWNNLLPNQTPRVPFLNSTVPCDMLLMNDYAERSPPDQKKMDEWIEKLDEQARNVVPPKEPMREVFFVIKQQVAFEKSYKPFTLVLKNENEQYYLGCRAAFLVKPAQTGYGLSYRQVPFQNPRADKVFVDSIAVEDASRGEYLLIFLFARPRDPKTMGGPTKENLNVSVKKG